MTTNCNEENCTCPKVNCQRHGKCCECINFHSDKPLIVYCMRRSGDEIENK